MTKVITYLIINKKCRQMCNNTGLFELTCHLYLLILFTVWNGHANGECIFHEQIKHRANKRALWRLVLEYVLLVHSDKIIQSFISSITTLLYKKELLGHMTLQWAATVSKRYLSTFQKPIWMMAYQKKKTRLHFMLIFIQSFG